MASGSGEHFLRQLSSSNGLQAAQDGYGGGRRRGSRRWSKKRAGRGYGGGGKGEAASSSAAAGRKRVMVVVDDSSGAKHAMMWALTHVANRGDFLTLLHVLPHYGAGAEEAPSLANSLGTLCKACRPELGAKQRGGGGGAVHQPGRVPDAGGEEAEQGRRRLPRQHPVAEELLAPRLTCPSAMSTTMFL
ncbi:uncharacterized protein LOC125545437 isoform X2 [Triticum urartu]|uniref:uncharacterized protein LOC125545437 isoform X2 n=1 Tax=Triticum urartu TaxID=4572 RepID=UPI002043E14B|nr:uncharacterized protein LOC125545437 isoform X2 [Triticum urartu]